MEHQSKFKQVIPTSGWHALYRTPDGAESLPLCAWVILEEEDGFQWMEGMVAFQGVTRAERDEDFLQYASDSNLEKEIQSYVDMAERDKGRSRK